MREEQPEDLYEILQVHPQAEPEVVEAAYRRLARMYHPDTNPSPDAARIMTSLNIAYATLGNPARRAEYDSERESSTPYRGEPVWGDSGHASSASPAPTPTRGSQTNAKKVGRWVAVLPGAVLAALIVMFPIHWVILLTYGIGGNIIVGFLGVDTAERLVVAFVTPFVIVRVGARISPSRRMETAIGLAVATALLLGAGYMFVFTSPTFAGWYSLHYGATPVLNLAGLAVGLYQAKDEYVTAD